MAGHDARPARRSDISAKLRRVSAGKRDSDLLAAFLFRAPAAPEPAGHLQSSWRALLAPTPLQHTPHTPPARARSWRSLVSNTSGACRPVLHFEPRAACCQNTEPPPSLTGCVSALPFSATLPSQLRSTTDRLVKQSSPTPLYTAMQLVLLPTTCPLWSSLPSRLLRALPPLDPRLEAMSP